MNAEPRALVDRLRRGMAEVVSPYSLVMHGDLEALLAAVEADAAPPPTAERPRLMHLVAEVLSRSPHEATPLLPPLIFDLAVDGEPWRIQAQAERVEVTASADPDPWSDGLVRYARPLRNWEVKATIMPGRFTLSRETRP